MKTIFITIGEDIIFRNIFKTNFWNLFYSGLENFNVRIIVLVKPESLDYFKDYFSSYEKVFVIAFKREKVPKKVSLLETLMRSCIDSHTNLWSKMRSYYRGDSSFLDTYIKRLHTFLLGRNYFYKNWLRKKYISSDSDSNAKKIFDEYNPSLLIASSITNFDFDVVLSREAKKRGIRLVGMPRSWDNFSSHGMVRVVPDKILVQDNFLVDMLKEYQSVDLNKTEVEVFGLPHYDDYFKKEKIEDREVFLNKMGIDKNKKIITYGAMGTFLFVSEEGVPELLNSIAENELKDENIQFIYRGHPKFKLSSENISKYKNILFDIESDYIDKKKDEDRHYINLLHHSDFIISGASTFIIDAISLDKKFISCIGFDPIQKKVKYWESVLRFYDTYTHFEALVETGNIYLFKNREELVSEIKNFLSVESDYNYNRDACIEKFFAPFDGKSAERLSDKLLLEIKK